MNTIYRVVRFLVPLWLVVIKCQGAMVPSYDEQGVYNIGTGVADITGPAGGVVLNGYVGPVPYAAGVHTRCFARAFIVESLETNNRVVFVTTDLGMFDHGIKQEVIKKLQQRYGENKYTDYNVMISATHTHSSPSGFMAYYSYIIIESYGFNPLVFWSIVDGVVESIEKADKSLQRGRVYWNEGEIVGYNRNRQSTAYNFNPEAERARYQHNVDKDMFLLRMETEDGNPIGCFNWWPVHPVSYNNGNNPLVSSDNKGYAAILFDQKMNGGKRPGYGHFVSGFASSNLGDVSPATGSENLISGEERNKVVGTKQFESAFKIFNDAANMKQITGPIEFKHQYIRFPNRPVTYKNESTGEEVRGNTCAAALGHSYVGLDPQFKWLWNIIRDILFRPSFRMIRCQRPKEVILPAGELNEPWQWSPEIIALQILRIGSVDLIGAPGEFTTMAGRRLRSAVSEITGRKSVVAGLANCYINYVTTPEEYDATEYEGGATIFGKFTLPAIIEDYKKIVEAMNTGEDLPSGPKPPSFLDKMRQKMWDLEDWPRDVIFGTVTKQPPEVLKAGETLEVIFAAGSPRHRTMRSGTYLTIEKLINEEAEQWKIVRMDSDLDTEFSFIDSTNRGIVKWNTPLDTEPGKYRVRHFGYWLQTEGELPTGYYGISNTFEIQSTT